MVIPGIPHHVTQRGNRRERTFFADGDYALYLDLLAEGAQRAGVEVWSYCLMPNHVHVIAVPRDTEGWGRAFRHVHRHYTGYVNARLRVNGTYGRVGSVRWRWTSRTCMPPFAMLRSIRCEPGWWNGRKIGRGRACGRTTRGRTIMWCASRRRSTGMGTFRPSERGLR